MKKSEMIQQSTPGAGTETQNTVNETSEMTSIVRRTLVDGIPQSRFRLIDKTEFNEFCKQWDGHSHFEIGCSPSYMALSIEALTKFISLHDDASLFSGIHIVYDEENIIHHDFDQEEEYLVYISFFNLMYTDGTGFECFIYDHEGNECFMMSFHVANTDLFLKRIGAIKYFEEEDDDAYVVVLPERVYSYHTATEED